MSSCETVKIFTVLFYFWRNFQSSRSPKICPFICHCSLITLLKCFPLIFRIAKNKPTLCYRYENKPGFSGFVNFKLTLRSKEHIFVLLTFFLELPNESFPFLVYFNIFFYSVRNLKFSILSLFNLRIRIY